MGNDPSAQWPAVHEDTETDDTGTVGGDELPLAEKLVSAARKGSEEADDSTVPVPLGFDEESWQSYLVQLAEEGQIFEHGGIQVVKAELEEPLVYEERPPMVDFVPIGEEEMEDLGVQPGDPVPGSTPMNEKYYILADGPSDLGAGPVEEQGQSKGFPGPPDGNSTEDYWDDKAGSGLAFGRDSSITVWGCSGNLFDLAPFERVGEALFYGSYTGNEEDIEVFYPSLPFPFISYRRTVYAKMISFSFDSINFFLWLVYKPEVWLSVGEDGWDDITLFADKEASGHPIWVTSAMVVHNDEEILQEGAVGLQELEDKPDSIPLAELIRENQLAEALGPDNITVQTAVGDYAQAASGQKYPVYSVDWNGVDAPRWWCSEFASWAFRAGAAAAGQEGYFDNLGSRGIPYAGSDDWGGSIDIGVKNFLRWARDYRPNPDKHLRFFGDSLPGHYYSGHYDNGPSPEEWEKLADWVEPGDYAAIYQHDRGHSMVVVGWLSDDDDNPAVGSEHFDPDRFCNRLLVVEGNVGAQPEVADGTGLGTIVRVGRRIVCRPDVGGTYYPKEPDCPLGECQMRLWDTAYGEYQPDVDEGGFFIDMSLPE